MRRGRPKARYYRRQPSHQGSSKHPSDHPPTVHVGERPLLAAVAGWLSEAVFGPERLDHWRAALRASSQPKAPSLTTERAKQLEAEIAELERRLERQLLSLETDDVTVAFRRPVIERVSKLEAAIRRGQGPPGAPPAGGA